MAMLGVAQGLKTHDEDEFDDDFEYIDERPNVYPVERPTHERNERPMRAPVSPRWGPARGRTGGKSR
jgi:hypothetical protein